MPKTLCKTSSIEEEDRVDNQEKSKAASCSTTAGSGGVSALTQNHHNLYKTIELKTGYIHEVIIRNSDPKSVLTWDFDVLRSDLHFSLFRVTKELPTQQGKLNGIMENIID